MKRIAIVAQGLSDGGAERVASILANYFNSKHYIVKYICAYSNKEEYKIEETITVDCIHTKATNRIIRLLDRNIKIYHSLRRFKPDAVIAFICNELLLSEVAGVPIIFTLRNDPNKIDCQSIPRILRNFAYRNAKAIVFQTNGAKEYFSSTIQNKGVIIPNPVDASILPIWKDYEHNKTFITACRLNKQKNIPMLIEAFVLVHESYPDYSLEIYGDGELKDSINNLIEAVGATSYIKLMGHSTHIHKIMAESFAFVLSSDYEGLSNSMLEALCMGIPVICTDCPPGGAREYIINGKSGLLTIVGDHKSMADNMQYLIENEQLREEFTKSSAQYRNQLKLSVIGGQWENIIR